MNPSASSTGGEAALAGRLSRRVVLFAGLAAGAGVLVGCGDGSFTPFAASVDQTKAWVLSTRNVASASNAAKAHAANRRFVSAAAADLGRAHPGDRSRIVSIDISPATWTLWFGGGADVVDLRRL